MKDQMLQVAIVLIMTYLLFRIRHFILTVGKRTVEREIKAIKWARLKRSMRSFFKDFDHYIDFCIARFLFWREPRCEMKRAKNNNMEG